MTRVKQPQSWRDECFFSFRFVSLWPSKRKSENSDIDPDINKRGRTVHNTLKQMWLQSSRQLSLHLITFGTAAFTYPHASVLFIRNIIHSVDTVSDGVFFHPVISIVPPLRCHALNSRQLHEVDLEPFSGTIGSRAPGIVAVQTPVDRRITGAVVRWRGQMAFGYSPIF